MTSVSRYLISVLMAVLVLTSFLAALQSYRLSAERVSTLFDQDLTLVANTLLQHYETVPGDHAGGLALQLSHQGRIIYRNPSAPEAPMLSPQGYSEQNFSSKRWRVYIESASDGWTVMVAQPLQQRVQLTDEVITASIYPVVATLPFQALLIWWAVTRALRPLRQFSAQLAQRKANDLSPVTLDQVPSELQLVLQSTNQLFERLSAAFEREKRFASDVAHELRTPLAVLDVTLHNVYTEWQKKHTENPDAIQALRQGVDRMRQLIEQILLLNRTHPDHFLAKTETLDWAALCRRVVADLYDQIDAKSQQISVEGVESLVVKGDAFALQILVSNLVGNASKYTPEGGEIRLTLRSGAGQAILDVEDSGPGIPAGERERVFERFYRVGGDRHPAGTPGAGLGLAIVRDIVALHGGHIQLDASSFATGLKVSVELPA
jgi:two-component system sensor histidine kinase QseC